MASSAAQGVWGGRPPEASTERPRLVLPGLIPADPRLERYRVHPGAVTAVELGPGTSSRSSTPRGASAAS